MEILPTVLWVVAALLVIVGFAGTIYPLLPGLPVMFAGFWLSAWVGDYERIGAVTLIILGLLALVGVLCDFLASALGAKRVGASKQAVTGAVIGSVVGIFLGIVGLILGPFIGAVIGEIIARRNVRGAAGIGFATWVGLLLGTIMKLALAFAMLGVFAFAWFI